MLKLTYFLCMLCVSSSVWANTYKWVDEHGKTHYGDTIPAQYAGQGTSEMDKKGLIIKKTPAALSPDQRKAQEDALASQKVEALKVMERSRKDKALLNTYSTEQEIDMARDRNLTQIDLAAQSDQVRQKSAQTRLTKFRNQSYDLIRSKKAVPAELKQDIENAEKEVAQINATLRQHLQNKEAARTRFEGDKNRYRDLTQATNNR